MKLNQIRYFLSILDHGGIRAGARALRVSQSNVAKSLTDLEAQCNSKLIIRNARGSVELTSLGKKLEPYFRSIYSNVCWIEDSVQYIQKEDCFLKIAITPLIATILLNDIYTWFRSRYPQTKLQFKDGLLSYVTPELKSGKLDYAIVLIMDDWYWEKDRIHVEELMSISQGFIARANHPIFSAKSMHEEVSDYEWLLTLDSYEEATDFMNQFIISQGIRAPKGIILVDTLMCYKLLHSTNCIAIAPTQLFAKAAGFESMHAIDMNKNLPDFQLPSLKLALLSTPNSEPTMASDYLAHCARKLIIEKLSNQLPELRET